MQRGIQDLLLEQDIEQFELEDLSGLKIEISEKDRENKTLKQTIEHQKQIIQEQETALHVYEARIQQHSIEAEIYKGKDDEIFQLQESLESHKQIIDKQNQIIAKQTHEMSKLENALFQVIPAQLKEVEKKMSDKDMKITMLQQQLEQQQQLINQLQQELTQSRTTSFTTIKFF